MAPSRKLHAVPTMPSTKQSERRRLRILVMQVLFQSDVQGHRTPDEADLESVVAEAGLPAPDAAFVRERGALDVYACATHALLSSPSGVVNMQAAELEELVVTNTVYIASETRKALPFLRVLSVADLLAEVIKRIHLGISVGELFNE